MRVMLLPVGVEGDRWNPQLSSFSYLHQNRFMPVLRDRMMALIAEEILLL